jgi:hypothetical protein
MVLIGPGLFTALAVFALGYALAARGGRRRLAPRSKRAAAAYEELETRLANLGAGLGIGA